MRAVLKPRIPLRSALLICLGFWIMGTSHITQIAQAAQDEAAVHNTAYQFNFTSIDGQDFSLSNYQGKVLLIVNTASRCGFTPQYEGLQALYDRYREAGLTVIGVPSDDFGKQELRDEAAIKEFCEVNFDIDFPLTAKTNVKGGNAHPFYRWAATQKGGMSKPRWNFHKYVVGRDGHITEWFSSMTAPESSKMIQAIEAALAQHPS